MSDSVFLLAFDHRNSYAKMFPDASDEQYAQGKVLVADAVNVALDRLGPDRGVGLLTDLVYGREAVAALDPGAQSAVAIERSGCDLFEFEWDDWRRVLDDLQPTYAKVLIRYRADDDEPGRALQAQRLAEVGEYCADAASDFLLEIITPLTDEEKAAADDDLDGVRLPILVAALSDLLERGIDPHLWKVEGLDHADSCTEVAAMTRQVRSDVGVVVLGAGAPAPTVDRWLQAAAGGGYDGFAVGRSIWSQPLADWFGGGSGDDAVEAVADRYLGFVSQFTDNVGAVT